MDKDLGRYIDELLRRSTEEDVARHLGMSWETVKDIHKRALSMKYKKRKIKHLSFLGVDEIAVRKGHSYLTVVIDLDTGQVVWVAEGRKSSSLEPFLRRLKKVNAPIKAIAMDMRPAYFTAVMKYYSYRCIVFDPYHVIASCNKMLDELRRRRLQQPLMSRKKVYTRTRYLLLKKGEKLTNNIEAKEKLENLLSLNQSLNIAYILKEGLRRFWQFTTRKEAKSYLMNWLHKAWISGIKPLAKFATTIASHHQGILNYFDHQITAGIVEGINNKIKILKRQAYGFRDNEYFKLRIYALHESRYALIG